MGGEHLHPFTCDGQKGGENFKSDTQVCKNLLVLNFSTETEGLTSGGWSLKNCTNRVFSVCLLMETRSFRLRLCRPRPAFTKYQYSTKRDFALASLRRAFTGPSAAQSMYRNIQECSDFWRRQNDGKLLPSSGNMPASSNT